MNVLDIPFNKFIGLEKSPDNEYLFMLRSGANYLNHVDTVHASAQFALAEATSGFFLFEEFRDLTDVLPVVRKVETKYRKPAHGNVFSKAGYADADRAAILEELNTKRRTLITVRVLLYDSEHNNIMQSDFEWFVAMND